MPRIPLPGPLPILSNYHRAFGDAYLVAPAPLAILVILHLCHVSSISVSVVPHLFRCRLDRYTSLLPQLLRIFPSIIARFLIPPPPSYTSHSTPTLPSLSNIPLSIFLRTSSVPPYLYSCAPQLKISGWLYLPLPSFLQFIYTHCDISPPKSLSPLSRISSVARPVSPLQHNPSSFISVTAIPVVPHLHCRNCLPPISTSNLFCHPHYPAYLRAFFVILPRLYWGPLFIFFHRHAPFNSVVCLWGSWVSAVSSTTSISIIPKYQPHHHPRLAWHLLCHFHCSPDIPAASIVAPTFIVIVYFILATLFVVCCHSFDTLMLLLNPCVASVVHLLVHSSLSDQIFSSLFVVLHYTDIFSLICTTFLTFWSNLLNIIIASLLARVFSLSLMFSLHSDLPHFFSTCLHSDPLQSVHFPQIYLLQSSCPVSILINYDFSDRALFCLFQSAWISSIGSALYFVILDLLIYLEIAHHYIPHHLLLACTIT